MNMTKVEHHLTEIGVSAAPRAFLVAFLRATDVPDDNWLFQTHKVILKLFEKEGMRKKDMVERLAYLIYYRFMKPMRKRSSSENEDLHSFISSRQSSSSNIEDVPETESLNTQQADEAKLQECADLLFGTDLKISLQPTDLLDVLIISSIDMLKMTVLPRRESANTMNIHSSTRPVPESSSNDTPSAPPTKKSKTEKQEIGRKHSASSIAWKTYQACCVDQTRSKRSATHVAHALPFSLINQPDIVHQTFLMLCPWLPTDFLRHIDTIRNMFVLERTLHGVFDAFEWYIEFKNGNYYARDLDDPETSFLSDVLISVPGKRDSVCAKDRILTMPEHQAPFPEFFKVHELVYRIKYAFGERTLGDFEFRAASEEFDEFSDDEEEMLLEAVPPTQMSLLEKMDSFFSSQVDGGSA